MSRLESSNPSCIGDGSPSRAGKLQQQRTLPVSKTQEALAKIYKPGPELKPMTSLRLSRLKFPKLKSYWGPFIHQGRLIFVAGPRGAGKSHFVMGLSVSMAIRPTKFGNKLLWPVAAIAALLTGEQS